MQVKTQSQILRVSVSDVSAICGYHEWKSKIDIFMKYVYQDLSELLSLDAKNLDLEIVTDDVLVNKILNSTSSDVRYVISDQISTEALEKISSNVVAQEVLNNLSELLNNEQSKGRINQNEKSFVIDKLSSIIKTSYGDTCEENVLLKYSDATGYAVTHRNQNMMVWPFHEQEHTQDNCYLDTVSNIVVNSYMSFNNNSEKRRMIRNQAKYNEISAIVALVKKYFFDIQPCALDNINLYKQMIAERKVIAINQTFALPYSTSTLCESTSSAYSKGEEREEIEKKGYGYKEYGNGGEEISLSADDKKDMLDFLINVAEDVYMSDGVHKGYSYEECRNASSEVTSSALTPKDSFPNIIDVECLFFPSICYSATVIALRERLELEGLDLIICECSVTDKTEEHIIDVDNDEIPDNDAPKKIRHRILVHRYLPKEKIPSVLHSCRIDSTTNRPSRGCSFLCWRHGHIGIPDVPGGSSPTLSSKIKLGIKNENPHFHQTPTFYIVGFIDGISEQLDCSATNASEWKPHHVIVEAKSRMGKVSPHNHPPLYDQIQLVTYMIMLGVKYGDLVEYISSQNSCTSSQIVSNATSREEINPKRRHIEQSDFAIHRITLHTPPYHHYEHFKKIILPNMCCFQRAVCTMRSDDMLRYHFLLGSESEKMEIIRKLCPHL